MKPILPATESEFSVRTSVTIKNKKAKKRTLFYDIKTMITYKKHDAKML